ncbi:amidohydrolase family protein [uncultured Acinetobacter sp.]|uniref:amidohydrolase family protein n=1 Tax=uncultured Acinetobacter sp. TaxID=165433 RepID=UPI0028D48826
MTMQHPQRLIDAHFHLWNLNACHYPWLSDQYQANTFMGDYRTLCKNYMLNDLRQDTAQVELIAGVHIEAEHSRINPWAELEWLQHQQQQHAFNMVYIAYAPMLADDISAYLSQLNRMNRVRGVRYKPVTSLDPNAVKPRGAGSLHDPQLRQNLNLLTQYNWVWDARVPYWHLHELAQLAHQLPELTIAVEHMGLPWGRGKEQLNQWALGMQQLADCPNISVKLSELSTPDRQWHWNENIELMQKVIDWFGIERCMFASNYPVAGLLMPYEKLVNAAQAALVGMSDQQCEQFFVHNAAQLYQIKL